MKVYRLKDVDTGEFYGRGGWHYALFNNRGKIYTRKSDAMKAKNFEPQRFEGRQLEVVEYELVSP